MDHKRAMETTKYVDLPSGNLPYPTKQEVKFMDLLNEYLLKYYAEHGNKNLYMELEGWSLFNVHETVVISRRFGFIKRLVENDKIDFSNFDYMINIKAPKRELYYTKAGFHTEAILMLLSIQENPIEFLTNIIK